MTVRVLLKRDITAVGRKVCILACFAFIHSFVDSVTKVDNYEFPSLSILCSSSPYHKYPKVTSHIYHSSIFLLDNPLSFFPPTCPPVSVDVTNHSNPSAHVPHISISSLSYLL